MPNVCFLPSHVSMLSRKNDFIVNKKSEYYEAFRQAGLSNIEYIDRLSTQRGVKPAFSNVDRSWKKCNKKQNRPRDLFAIHGQKLASEYLRSFCEFEEPVAGDLTEFEYNFESSPAKVWKLLGYRTKGDALKSPLFIVKVYGIDHIPLVDVRGKVELLPLDEIIMEEKIRTFFPVPIDFVHKQKMLWHNQNEALKRNSSSSWIKYGMVKQYGGFSQLGKEFERFEIVEEGDVSGWDREADLSDCYEIRLENLQNQNQYSPLFKAYVVDNSVCPFIVCPDGVLRRKKTGNISGSNNTTSDNCIKHLIIKMRLVTKIYYDMYSCLPTLTEVMANHNFAIFSDDSLGGHNISEYGLTKEEFIEENRKNYLEYGMVLKEKQVFVSENKPGKPIDPRHSFLGSYFHWDYLLDMYVPYPRVDKIASTLYWVVKSNDIEAEIQKAAALCVLSAPVLPLHQECVRFLNFLLTHYYIPKRPDILKLFENVHYDNPTIWLLSTLGRESYSSCDLESNILNRSKEGFNIFFCGFRQSKLGRRLVFEMSTGGNTNAGALVPVGQTRSQRRKANKMGQNAPITVEQINNVMRVLHAAKAMEKPPAVKQLMAGKRRNVQNKASHVVKNGQPIRRLQGSGDYTEAEAKKKIKKLKKKNKKLKKKGWWDKILDFGGEWIPKIAPMLLAGMGDYEPQDKMPITNSITAAATEGKIGGEVPYMHNTGSKTRIAHREYLGDIYSSTSAFSAITFAINPGMNEAFPWLCTIANNYTNYRLLGMCVEFKSEGSSYSNTTGLGYVAIATQYNVNEATFTDKRTMLNSEFATSAKPDTSFLHCIECKASEVGAGGNIRSVRAGSIEGTQDLRLYDWGKFTVAVGGNTSSNQIIGELWLSYDIEFELPKSIDAAAVNTKYSVITTSTGVANASPLGTSAWSYGGQSTFQFKTLSSTQLVFPDGARGRYGVIVVWTGGAGAAANPGVTYTNCSSIAWLVSAASQNGLAGQTTHLFATAVDIIQDNATITFDGTGTILTTKVDITSFQFPVNDNLDSKIFDRLGRNEQNYYTSFMKSNGILVEKERSKIFSAKSGNIIYQTKNFTVVEKDEEGRFYQTVLPEVTAPLTKNQMKCLACFDTLAEVDDFLNMVWTNLNDESLTEEDFTDGKTSKSLC